MVWQDITITLANILMGYALIPQVIRGFKTKKRGLSMQTTSITVIGLLLMIVSFFTLELYLSFGITLITSTLWGILFVQSIIYRD